MEEQSLETLFSSLSTPCPDLTSLNFPICRAEDGASVTAQPRANELV